MIRRNSRTAKAHAEIARASSKKNTEYKDLTRGNRESKAMLAEETDAAMTALRRENELLSWSRA